MTEFSVIIPTIDRVQAVQDVLRDLAAQELLPREIFVVDQGAGAQERDELLDGTVPLYWRVQRTPNASMARNAAAKLASSDWLLFLDDDVRFDATLLAQYAVVIEQLSVDACTGGVLGPRDTWSDVPKPEADGRWLREWRVLSSYRTTRQSMRVQGACSANFLIRRDVLFKLGGFDERYGGVCEDTELGMRLSKAGLQIWHDPRPWVHHLMIPSGGSRRAELVKQELDLSVISPRTMSLHLLMLVEHFGWVSAWRFIMFRFAEFVVLRKTFLRPARLWRTVAALCDSIRAALRLKQMGPARPLGSLGID